MANICENEMIIRFKSHKKAKKFEKTFFTKEEDEETFVWNLEKHISLHSNPTAMEAYEIWGTKWKPDVQGVFVDKNILSASFLSANAPPFKIYQHLFNNKDRYGIDKIYAEAFETGADFIYIFNNGEEKDMKGVEKNMGKLDLFDLSTLYNQSDSNPISPR